MLVRIVEFSGASIEDACHQATAVLKSKRCTVLTTSEDHVFEFSGLRGVSSLATGCGKLAVDSAGAGVSVRLELAPFITSIGVVIGCVSLLLAIPTLGLSFFLFWLMRDQAAIGLQREFDRLADEIASAAKTLPR